MMLSYKSAIVPAYFVFTKQRDLLLMCMYMYASKLLSFLGIFGRFSTTAHVISKKLVNRNPYEKV